MSPNISPTRIAVINLLILSLLITLVARLWYLQVLAGGEAQKLAERTSIRFVYEQAPRGFIFDREGRTLARNRTALTVALEVARVPEDRKDQLIRDLARVLRMEEEKVRAIVEDKRLDPNTPRPIALDVDKNVVVYLAEHSDWFPGVTDVEIPVREYPLRSVASHVIGHIGEVNADELHDCKEREEHAAGAATAARQCRPGDLVGKVGVEKVYNTWLFGRTGMTRQVVNVTGQKVGAPAEDQPQRGWDAILTLDAGVQVAAENALQDGITLARGLTDPDTGKKFAAPAGAVVALDPGSGEVLALASNPNFDPNILVGSAPPGALEALNAPDANMPFLNRAIAEAVPPGSTFKPITASAAWDVEKDLDKRMFECPPYIKIGNQLFHDWQPDGQGTLDLAASIAQSCDITFYRLGVELDGKKKQIGEKLQEVARQFGLGRPTDIDLLGEMKGRVPDAAWKWQTFDYAQTYDRRWFPGDAANLAIGQGFLQVTPLQLATAYGAIANRGTIMKPHVLKCLSELDVSQATDVDNACRSGRVPKTAEPKVLGHVRVPAAGLRFMEDAMAGTVRGSGTAADAFEGFPLDRIFVAGKTGTAQMPPRQPFSWFAAIAKQGTKQIVVVALVEEAGTGSQIAAPIVRKVLEQYFNLSTSGGIHLGEKAD
jgi:penicillin-binding protein 2